MWGIDLKWIIIGGVLVVLMVAFGNNPVENARRERAEAMKDKDPVLESIKEYNEENTIGGVRVRRSATTDFNNSYPDNSYTPPQGNSYTGGDPYSQMPSYMYRDGQIPPPASNQQYSSPERNQQSTPSGSYYPPAP